MDMLFTLKLSIQKLFDKTNCLITWGNEKCLLIVHVVMYSLFFKELCVQVGNILQSVFYDWKLHTKQFYFRPQQSLITLCCMASTEKI